MLWAGGASWTFRASRSTSSTASARATRSRRRSATASWPGCRPSGSCDSPMPRARSSRRSCPVRPRCRRSRELEGFVERARGRGVTDRRSRRSPDRSARNELGFTLVHEHVACASAGRHPRAGRSLYGGREALIDRAVEILTRAREDGVGTIVDATPFDLGRDVAFLAECAERSGMRIIACSGHWLVPAPATANRTTDQLARLFIAELTEGADGTSDPGGRAQGRERGGDRAVRPAGPRSGDRRAPRDGRADHHARGGAQPDRRAPGGGVRGARRRPGRVVIGHSDDTTGHHLPHGPGRPRLRHRDGPPPLRRPARVRRPDRSPTGCG